MACGFSALLPCCVHEAFMAPSRPAPLGLLVHSALALVAPICPIQFPVRMLRLAHPSMMLWRLCLR